MRIFCNLAQNGGLCYTYVPISFCQGLENTSFLQVVKSEQIFFFSILTITTTKHKWENLSRGYLGIFIAHRNGLSYPTRDTIDPSR